MTSDRDGTEPWFVVPDEMHAWPPPEPGPLTMWSGESVPFKLSDHVRPGSLVTVQFDDGPESQGIACDVEELADGSMSMRLIPDPDNVSDGS